MKILIILTDQQHPDVDLFSKLRLAELASIFQGLDASMIPGLRRFADANIARPISRALLCSGCTLSPLIAMTLAGTCLFAQIPR
jgi:hypothetical protein